MTGDSVQPVIVSATAQLPSSAARQLKPASFLTWSLGPGLGGVGAKHLRPCAWRLRTRLLALGVRPGPEPQKTTRPSCSPLQRIGFQATMQVLLKAPLLALRGSVRVCGGGAPAGAGGPGGSPERLGVDYGPLYVRCGDQGVQGEISPGLLACHY